jgi:hypothetical protein
VAAIASSSERPKFKYQSISLPSLRSLPVVESQQVVPAYVLWGSNVRLFDDAPPPAGPTINQEVSVIGLRIPRFRNFVYSVLFCFISMIVGLDSGCKMRAQSVTCHGEDLPAAQRGWDDLPKDASWLPGKNAGG